MPTSFLLIFLCLFTSLSTIQAQDSAIADSLKQLAVASNVPIEKSKLYHQLAKQQLGVDFEAAEQYERLSLQFCPLDNHVQLGDSYNLFAAIYAQTSQSPKALNYIDSSIYHYKIIKDTVGLVIAYNTKGAILIQLQQIEKGAEYLYKSLNITEKTGNLSTTITGLLNLSSVYQSIGEIDKAMVACKRALVLADSISDKEMGAFASQSMGALAFNSSQLDSSLVYYQNSIQRFEEIQYHEQVALSYGHTAHLHALLKQPSAALKAIGQAKKLQKYIGSKNNFIELQLNFSHAYCYIGNYEQSLSISLSLLDSAYLLQDLYLQEQVLNSIIINNVQLNDFEAAYNYRVERGIVLDSLMTYEKQADLLELDTKYQTDKITQENKLLAKEKDIETLRADNNQQLLYFSIFTLLLIIIISILLVRQSKINAARLTNQLKHRLLRNQMSPHFIFNSLVAIQNFVYKSNPIQAGEYLASFAQLMRTILENSREEYISLEKEIQWLNNYLKLQLLRFDNSFVYSIDLDPAIDLDNVLIPPMLTQPFIENSLEHGLQNINYQGEVNVKISVVKDLLHITVADNGVGLEATASPSNKQHTSLAVNITKERLSFLNRRRGKKIFFDIKSLHSKGTLVSFSLPLNYKY